MAASFQSALKRWARRLLGVLPRPVARAFRRGYYYSLVRRFRHEEWPPSAGVRQLLQAGQRAVDVGANIGHVTCFLSRCVGEGGRVYSVEPIPETFDVLRHNIRKLRLRNVEAFNCALSSREGAARMAVPEYEDGGRNYYESRVMEPGEAGGAALTVTVRLRRLDELLFRTPPPVHFMKIDAEGHELEVLLGAEQIVRRDHPVLLIEVAGDPEAPGSSAQKLFQFLEQEGYRPHVLAGDRLEPRRPGQRAVDYFFLPGGKT